MTNLPTIYKDAGGIGALPGDNVRMLLDVNALELGPELVTNGDLLVAGDGLTDRVYRQSPDPQETIGLCPVVNGNWYVVEWISTQTFSGSTTFRIDGGGGLFPGGFNAGTPLSGRVIGRAGKNGLLGINGDGDGSLGVFDFVSVREISGIHADQPSTSLQPVLGRAPKERRNLVKFSEAVGSWVQTAGAQIFPVYQEKSGFTEWGQVEQSDQGASRIYDQGIIVAQPGEKVTGSIVLDTNLTQVRGDGSGRFSFSLGDSGSHRVTISINPVTGEVSQVMTSSYLEITAGPVFTDELASGVFRYTVTATAIKKRDMSLSFWRDGAEPNSPYCVISGAMLAKGESTGEYQKVKANGFDITEPGNPSYSYLRFDGVDDKLPQVYPSAKTGDLMIFGRKGSWIDLGVSVAAGGTLNAISGKDSPKTPGIIPALGDIVAWYHAPQTLNAYERAKLTEYFRERGAKGLLVSSGVELIENGGFDSDLSKWDTTVGFDWGADGVAAYDGSGNGDLRQNINLIGGDPYIVKVKRTSPSSSSSQFFVLLGGTQVLAKYGIEENTFTFAGIAGNDGQFRLYTNGTATQKFDDISVQKLVTQ